MIKIKNVPFIVPFFKKNGSKLNKMYYQYDNLLSQSLNLRTSSNGFDRDKNPIIPFS